MKSDNEEFCRAKFDEFVKAASKLTSILWEDVAQKDEPPDYFVYLDDIKYAVEVTILMEKVEIESHKRPQIEVIVSLWQLVDKVEATARENGYLNGAYVVSFSQPLPKSKKIREQLFNDLLTYVKVTQNVSIAPEKVVFKQGIQKCTIEKLHGQKNYIGKVGPGSGKWEGEAAQEICALLEERINTKAHKLRKVAEPKILLLYDAYHFASSEMYKSCLNSLTSLHSFHTVFIVGSNEVGWGLYSENSNWSNYTIEQPREALKQRTAQLE